MNTEHFPKPNQIYYHFKREAEKGVEHGAYLVLGVGMNTEDRSDLHVILKPLYFCDPRWPDEKGISYQVRPLENFLEQVNKPELNYSGPRFKLIEDEETLAKLRTVFLFSSQF